MKAKTLILKNKFVVGLIAVVLVYLFIVKPMIGKRNRNFEIDIIDNKDVESNNLTVSESEAQSIADEIYIEMKGFNWMGADDQFWQYVMKQVQTPDDALLVIKKFGQRDSETLPEWLRNETSLRFLSYRDLIIEKFKVV